MVAYRIHRSELILKAEIDFARVLILLDAAYELAERNALSLHLRYHIENEDCCEESAVRVEEVTEIVVSCKLTAVNSVDFTKLEGSICTTHTPCIHNSTHWSEILAYRL